jgi:hypothetical protein
MTNPGRESSISAEMFVEVIRSLTSDEKEELIQLWARDVPQTSPGLTSFSEGRVAELRNDGDVLSVLAQLETLSDMEFERLGEFLYRGYWEYLPPRVLRYGNELG